MLFQAFKLFNFYFLLATLMYKRNALYLLNQLLYTLFVPLILKLLITLTNWAFCLVLYTFFAEDLIAQHALWRIIEWYFETDAALLLLIDFFSKNKFGNVNLFNFMFINYGLLNEVLYSELIFKLLLEICLNADFFSMGCFCLHLNILEFFFP
jgi:hypothetical protein